MRPRHLTILARGPELSVACARVDAMLAITVQTENGQRHIRATAQELADLVG
ncbi:hypothetical protein [Nonomuraea sp. NPDC003709]|uniref:hypothetical protein n=1 Tax=Nonomuraea sp. NPDC003709 TaxID=3154450 RepID=UPI0033A8FEAE